MSGMRQAANFVGIILTAMLFWDMTSCHVPEDCLVFNCCFVLCVLLLVVLCVLLLVVLCVLL